MNVQVVVSTHQILLDALSHGFVSLKDLALLVFDEGTSISRPSLLFCSSADWLQLILVRDVIHRD
jgi:hypothetical protein